MIVREAIGLLLGIILALVTLGLTGCAGSGGGGGVTVRHVHTGFGIGYGWGGRYYPDRPIIIGPPGPGRPIEPELPVEPELPIEPPEFEAVPFDME